MTATAASLPVDKGGLSDGTPPAPLSSRVILQRVCYGIAGLFVAGAVVTGLAVSPGVSLLFAVPVSLCIVGARALGLEKPSLRQGVTLWCVVATLLSCTGISMMPHDPPPIIETLRDFGFMVSSAAAVLSFICAFLPPYKGDGLLRDATLVFCGFTLALTYMGVHFVCTPHGH